MQLEKSFLTRSLLFPETLRLLSLHISLSSGLSRRPRASGLSWDRSSPDSMVDAGGGAGGGWEGRGRGDRGGRE